MERPPVFLRAEWRWLAMFNFEVDPAALAPFVPEGTELDFWNGRTYLSVVGFRFLRTRVLGIPVPFHRDFDEVNLRFYVRRQAREGVRRGVVFIKEIVPKRMVTWVANRVYNEHYVTLPMRHQIDLPQPGRPVGSLAYHWQEGGRWHGIQVGVRGETTQPAADSEATFITEHYWGYTRQRDGSTLEYQVEHPPWRIWEGENPRFDCDIEQVYGPAFVKALSVTPTSVFVADGSAVLVRRGRRLVSGEW